MLKARFQDDEPTVRKDYDYEAAFLSATDPLALSGVFSKDRPSYIANLSLEYKPKETPMILPVHAVSVTKERVTTQPISIPMSKAQVTAKTILSQFSCTQDFVPCSPNLGSFSMDLVDDHAGASSYTSRYRPFMTNTSVTAKIIAKVKQLPIQRRSAAPKIVWGSPLVVSKENTPENTPDSLPLLSTEVAQKMPNFTLS